MKKKIGLFILIVLGVGFVPFCFLNHDTEKIKTEKSEVEEEAKVYTCEEDYWKTAYAFDPGKFTATISESGDNWIVTASGVPATVYVMVTSNDAEIQDIDEAGNKSGKITPGDVNSGFLTATIPEGQTEGTISYTFSKQTLENAGTDARGLEIVVATMEQKTDNDKSLCPAQSEIYTIEQPTVVEQEEGNLFYDPVKCAEYQNRYIEYALIHDSIPYCDNSILYESQEEVDEAIASLDQLYNSYLILKSLDKEIEIPENYTKVDNPNDLISLQCDAYQTRNSIDVSGNLYAGQEKYYAKATTYENNSCKTVCQEKVTVSYQAPVATQAGICFSYKVDIQSTVNCNVVEKQSKPQKSDFKICNALSVCTHSGGSKTKRGGPDEEFDDCILNCDGGEYTQDCIESCYDEVYQEDEMIEETSNTTTESSTSTLTLQNDMLTWQEGPHAIFVDTPVNVDGVVVSCNSSFQGPRPFYTDSNGKDYTAKQVYQYRKKNPGGYYQKGNNGWEWVPSGDCPSSVAYIYFKSVSMTEATLRRFRNARSWVTNKCTVGSQEKACAGSNRPYENRQGFQVVRIRLNYSAKDANTDAGDVGSDTATKLLAYDCHSTCEWKASTMTNCDGPNAILTKSQQTAEYKKALNTWQADINNCAKESQCKESTTTYTIDVDKGTQNEVEYKGQLAAKPNPSLPDIIEHAGGICYNIDETNAEGEKLNYHNVVSFPKTWLSVKNGVATTKKPKNENLYLYVGDAFCPSLSSDNLNLKWYDWRINDEGNTNENVLTEERKKQIDEELEKTGNNINVHIGNKDGNYLWGLLGWNIDVNCFYAVAHDADICTEKCCGEECCDPICPDKPVLPTYTFRTISLKDVFPPNSAEKTGRKPNFNWTCEASNTLNDAYPIQPTATIDAIEDKGNTIFSDANELDYAFDLSRSDLKKIKAYNDTRENYLDYDDSAVEMITNGVTVYKSRFLRTELASSAKKLGVLGCNNQYAGACINVDTTNACYKIQEAQKNNFNQTLESNSSGNSSSNTGGSNSSGNSSSNTGNGSTSSGNSSSNKGSGNNSSGNNSSNKGNGNTSSGNSSSNKGNGQSGSTANQNISNLENAESYTSVKVLKTIEKSKLTKLTSVSGVDDCTATQSLAVAGNYIVVANVNKNNDKTALQVYKKSTGEKVNTIKDDFYHANGMTYNANNNKLYIVHNDDKQYTSFSAKNISSKKTLSKTTVDFEKAISGIAYDKDTNQYYFGKGKNIYVADENFNHIKTIKKIRHQTPQDIGAYKGLIMVILTTSPSYNAIDLYRASDGAYVGTYEINLPNSELESVVYYGNNKFALLFNSSPDVIYTTSEIDLK